MNRIEMAIKTFDYSNGRLVRKIFTSNNQGDGWIRNDGYRMITMGNKEYREHRLIWEMHNGPISDEMQIDHVNHVRDDNRIENLRLVNQSENNKNLTMKRNNSSGVIGVSFDKLRGKWTSYINNGNKKRVSLGRFDSFEDAVKARKKAEVIYGYHKNHGVSGDYYG